MDGTTADALIAILPRVGNNYSDVQKAVIDLLNLAMIATPPTSASPNKKQRRS